MLSAVQQRGEGQNFIAFWDLETPKEDVDQGTRWTGQEHRAGWRMQTRVPNTLNKSENTLWDRGQSSFTILNREMPTNYGILKNRWSTWFSELDQEGEAAINHVITYRAKDISSALPGLIIKAKSGYLSLQGWEMREKNKECEKC